MRVALLNEVAFIWLLSNTFTINLPFCFLFRRILFIVISVWVFTAHAVIASELVEDSAYGILKGTIRAKGKSNGYAECVVEVLKFTGASRDVTDIRNIFQPEELASKLNEKINFADFVCSGGALALVLTAAFLICLCCVCCCCCRLCCCRPKPTVIQVATIPRRFKHDELPLHPSKDYFQTV